MRQRAHGNARDILMEVKKSFSFRFRFSTGRSGADDPASVAETDPERAFRPVADRYRQRMATFILVMLAGIGLAFLSLLVPEPVDKWVGIPGVVCIFTGLALFFTLPGLRCPNCGKTVGSGFGEYCPACGHAPIEISRLRGTRCRACHRTMGSYKYRNYPIRHCTHCGTLLHGRGV